MDIFLNILITFCGSYIMYQLALAIIGVNLSFIKTLIPAIIYTTVIFVSKCIFNNTAVIHTFIIVITCILLIFLYNKISIYLSVIGGLLSIIIITIGSNLIFCPIAIQLGFDILTGFPENPDWYILNLIEIAPPLIVLIVLKTKKLSFTKFLENVQG